MKKILFYTLLYIVAITSSYSCGEYDDWEYLITLYKTFYIMHPNEIATIDGCGLDVAKWNSKNEFVAVAKADKITSNKIGTTTISYNGQGIRVTVNPNHHLYTEPDMSWGSNKSSIISKYGVPYADNGNTILYKTSNSDVPFIAYMFNEGGLFSCGAIVLLSAGGRLLDFLDERYVFYSVNIYDYTASFAHCYGKKDNPQIDYAGQMAYQSSIGGILVVYANNRSTRSVDINTIFNSMTESIKGSM